MDLAALAIPVSVLAFASFSLWNTRRRVLKRDAERDMKEKSRTQSARTARSNEWVQGAKPLAERPPAK